MPEGELRAVRLRLIRGLKKIIADAEQMIRDTNYWNNHRTDAPPFDCGREIVLAEAAKKCLAKVEAGERCDDEYQRLLEIAHADQ